MRLLDIFRRRTIVAQIKQPMHAMSDSVLLKNAKLTPLSMKMLQSAINDLRQRRADNRPPSYKSVDQLQNILIDAMGGKQQNGLLIQMQDSPLDMVLFCPACHVQHVDSVDPSIEWANPPHRSHLCHGCGCIWRPADIATNGVLHIKTQGTRDTWFH